MFAFFLALLLLLRRGTAATCSWGRIMPRTHLLMMLGSHLLLMMLRAHLLLMMLHLLIHRMRSVSSASVLDCVAGTHRHERATAFFRSGLRRMHECLI